MPQVTCPCCGTKLEVSVELSIKEVKSNDFSVIEEARGYVYRKKVYNDPITCIKAIRESTGCGLIEAKRAFDNRSISSTRVMPEWS